ncbi:MAG: hypothetical protein ACYC0V_00375 [Armatimonadota bacterium]
MRVFIDTDIVNSAGLRLPCVSGLFYEMNCYDGVPISGLPLTVGEARKRLLELIPEDLIVRQLESDRI